MNWTDEIPAEPGFFWCRDGATPRVVEVVLGLPLQLYFPGDETGYGRQYAKSCGWLFWPERLQPPR